jgi:hypothetical protein
MLELAELSRAFGSLRVIDRLDFTVEAGWRRQINALQPCSRRLAAKRWAYPLRRCRMPDKRVLSLKGR